VSRARRNPCRLDALVGCALAALAGVPASAQFMTGRGRLPEPGVPASSLTAREIVERVGFDQRLGAALPLDAEFRDETGRSVRLGELLGSRPVVFAPVYYRCPMLCTLVERGAAMAAKPLDLLPGRDFDFVFVSFDPTDTPERAAGKKAAALAEYGRPGTAAGWRFLSGDERAVRAFTEAVGFRYAVDPATGEYAHASGLVVVTPDGRVSRYLYGAEYAPRDLRLALVESSAGRIGGPIDQLMLFCFNYDAGLGRYTAVSMLSLRVAALVTLAALGLYFLVALRRGRLARRAAAGGLA
jgi:protein SCO1/2